MEVNNAAWIHWKCTLKAKNLHQENLALPLESDSRCPVKMCSFMACIWFVSLWNVQHVLFWWLVVTSRCGVGLQGDNHSCMKLLLLPVKCQTGFIFHVRMKKITDDIEFILKAVWIFHHPTQFTVVKLTIIFSPDVRLLRSFKYIQCTK